MKLLRLLVATFVSLNAAPVLAVDTSPLPKYDDRYLGYEDAEPGIGPENQGQAGMGMVVPPTRKEFVPSWTPKPAAPMSTPYPVVPSSKSNVGAPGVTPHPKPSAKSDEVDIQNSRTKEAPTIPRKKPPPHERILGGSNDMPHPDFKRKPYKPKSGFLNALSRIQQNALSRIQQSVPRQKPTAPTIPELLSGRYLPRAVTCGEDWLSAQTEEPSGFVVKGDEVLFYEAICKVASRKLTDESHRIWSLQCKEFGITPFKVTMEFWRDGQQLMVQYDEEPPKCAFRRIRPPVPATSGHPFRRIRPLA